MAFVIFNLLCVAALVGADQAIKFWAVQVLEPVGSMPLIPHVVELRFVLNQGMAFSLHCFWWLTGCFSAAVASTCSRRLSSSCWAAGSET